MLTNSSLFDVIFAIEAVTSAAIVTAILAFILSGTVAGRVRAVIVLTIWFAAVVVLGATGALGEHGLGAPALGLAVLLPIAALAVALRRMSAARTALSEFPLWILIAAHGLRVLGFAFLVLYGARRLPAPFAPVAGWGDILVGALAVPVAWMAARRGMRAKWAILTWNVVGTMDLITAIGLGTISSPGPIQLLTQSPGSALMTTLPWILIPCFLVPAFQALHIAIFYRLSGAVADRSTANAGRPNSLSGAPFPDSAFSAPR